MTSFGEKFLSFKIQIRLEFPLFISILMSCFQMYIGTKELNVTLIVFHLPKAVRPPTPIYTYKGYIFAFLIPNAVSFTRRRLFELLFHPFFFTVFPNLGVGFKDLLLA